MISVHSRTINGPRPDLPPLLDHDRKMSSFSNRSSPLVTPPATIHLVPVSLAVFRSPMGRETVTRLSPPCCLARRSLVDMLGSHVSHEFSLGALPMSTFSDLP